LTAAPEPHCGECGSPLAEDQRYCLLCGARAAAPSPALERLMAGAGNRLPPAVGPAGEPPRAPAGDRLAEADAQGVRASWATLLSLPSRPVSALLLAAFLGFGVLLGVTAGSPVDSTLAANAGSRLRLVLPAAAPVAGAASPAALPASGSGGEPPAAEPEPTPAPAATATSRAPKTAPPGAEVGAGEAGAGAGPSVGEGGSSGAAAPATKLPPIKHVFLIALSNEPYASVFGPASGAHYLAGTLERRGELLVRYDAVAHEELADGVALVSGQGPTAQTAANCADYADLSPATTAAEEQVLGSGCVYPRSTETLAGQLAAGHLTWRAYVEGIDEAGGSSGACSHPALGQPDPTAEHTASTGPYATFRNPFLYFHSIIDSPACAADDVGLGQLGADLASAKRTPSFSYIVPDRCHDGNPTPCSPGAPAGMGPADAFLARVAPQILGSKAYADGGLIVITVDEAPSSGEFADSSSCCGQPRFPNLASAPTGLSPRGGGTVGALLLSRYVKGGTTSQEQFNHFSLLRSIEDLFSLRHLGYAALPAVKAFPPSLFTAAPSR
jgi:hypothetical protein